jgi:ubiquitin carboxyl-terminal hydrolase 48
LSNKDDQKSHGLSTDTVTSNNNSHREAVLTSTVGEMFSSTDAYMLMFKLTSKDESAAESNNI